MSFDVDVVFMVIKRKQDLQSKIASEAFAISSGKFSVSFSLFRFLSSGSTEGLGLDTIESTSANTSYINR